MKILKSIDARRKNYYLHHFEKSKYGKNLKMLNEKYTGKRCFIIGNGPSLRAEDLDLLVNEYSFAFNRIYYMFDKTEWRPTFYCTQDEKIVRNSLMEIKNNIKTPYIFAPINLYWYYGLDLNTNYYFCPKQTQSDDEVPVFSEDISHEIGVGNTVAFTAMQLAAYMGFSEIYLLGIDHSFHISQDKKGNIVVDPNTKDYFCDEYNQDKEKLFIPKLDVSILSYQAAQKYAEFHENKIYNATRGGKLEVFPRVDYDSLIKNSSVLLFEESKHEKKK